MWERCVTRTFGQIIATAFETVNSADKLIRRMAEDRRRSSKTANAQLSLSALKRLSQFQRFSF